MTTSTHHHLRIAALGAAALCAAVLPACRGDRSPNPPRQFLPDMDDAPKWKPQTQSEFFVDGRSMRQPVAGTVPFGASTDAGDPGRAAYLAEDLVFNTGKDGRATTKDPLGDVVANMPQSAIDAFKAAGADDSEASRKAALSAMLARGEDRFNIYCSVCHGFDAKGGGTVGIRMTIPPANLHEKRFRDRKVVTGGDGHFFDVIRNGWNNGNMPGYAHAINAKDAWAVVLYVRALQEATAGQVQPGDLNPPAAAAPATPATGGKN